MGIKLAADLPISAEHDLVPDLSSPDTALNSVLSGFDRTDLQRALGGYSNQEGPESGQGFNSLSGFPKLGQTNPLMEAARDRVQSLLSPEEQERLQLERERYEGVQRLLRGGAEIYLSPESTQPGPMMRELDRRASELLKGTRAEVEASLNPEESEQLQEERLTYAAQMAEYERQGGIGVDRPEPGKMMQEVDRRILARLRGGSLAETPIDQEIDEGAKRAIEKFERTHSGPISGEDLAKLIKEATEDLDGHANGSERRALEEFIDKHSDDLTPEARDIWNIYVKAADSCPGAGMPQDVVAEMEEEWRERLQTVDTEPDAEPGDEPGSTGEPKSEPEVDPEVVPESPVAYEPDPDGVFYVDPKYLARQGDEPSMIIKAAFPLAFSDDPVVQKEMSDALMAKLARKGQIPSEEDFPGVLEKERNDALIKVWKAMSETERKELEKEVDAWCRGGAKEGPAMWKFHSRVISALGQE